MANVDADNVLGLIDSNKGEIICKDCLTEAELAHIAEEEAITQDKILNDDSYLCSRCDKKI
jgi:hypothetical protein